MLIAGDVPQLSSFLSFKSELEWVSGRFETHFDAGRDSLFVHYILAEG